MIKTFLFDMDGVVANTEVQYDIFLQSFIEEYNLPETFLSEVKGVRWPDIIKRYFKNSSEVEIQKILDKVYEFEANDLIYENIPGVVPFINKLKLNNYKLGLVTSSLKPKTEIALRKMNLENVFDVVITGSDVKKGKPDPECYLLGAKKLNSLPSECIVFEDSFAGIEAGLKAGMEVVALSTTNSEISLKEKVKKVYPNFIHLPIEDLV